jgi:hypothetical protein
VAGISIGIKESVGCPCQTAGAASIRSLDRQASFLPERIAVMAESPRTLKLLETLTIYLLWRINHLPIDIISYIMSQMPTFTEQTCSDRPAPKRSRG